MYFILNIFLCVFSKIVFVLFSPSMQLKYIEMALSFRGLIFSFSSEVLPHLSPVLTGSSRGLCLSQDAAHCLGIRRPSSLAGGTQTVLWPCES